MQVLRKYTVRESCAIVWTCDEVLSIDCSVRGVYHHYRCVYGMLGVVFSISIETIDECDYLCRCSEVQSMDVPQWINVKYVLVVQLSMQV